MRAGLVLIAALGAALTVPAWAGSPVERWGSGDWWEVQMEHLTFHSATPRAGWTPSFRLRFNVVSRTEREVRVEVTTIPENRFKERLVLRYRPNGELISAQIVDPERVEELGPAGGFGPFGMLGREAFDLSKAPPRPNEDRKPVRVPMDARGETVQTWGPDDPWWLSYETGEGVPQRAAIVGASWRRPIVPEQTVTNGPEGGADPPNAPAAEPESMPAEPEAGPEGPPAAPEPGPEEPQAEPEPGEESPPGPAPPTGPEAGDPEAPEAGISG